VCVFTVSSMSQRHCIMLRSLCTHKFSVLWWYLTTQDNKKTNVINYLCGILGLYPQVRMSLVQHVDNFIRASYFWLSVAYLATRHITILDVTFRRMVPTTLFTSFGWNGVIHWKCYLKQYLKLQKTIIKWRIYLCIYNYWEGSTADTPRKKSVRFTSAGKVFHFLG